MLPNSLLYLVDRLQGFSTNTLRVEPTGHTTARPTSTLTFKLPANDVLDLRSFRIFFKPTLTGTVARLPADIHSLIKKVDIRCGGQSLTNGGEDFNVLLKAQQAVCEKKFDALSHNEVVRSKSYVDGNAISGTNPENYSTMFCWNDWSNTFLGTAEPSIIDTSIMPALEVIITLADNTVLSSSASSAMSSAGFLTAPGSPNASYTINDVFASVESLTFNDNSYSTMVSGLMDQKKYLEIPFKRIVSFSDKHSGSSPFHISTQSLDRIWITYRADGYDTQGAPVPIGGYKRAGAWVGASDGATSTTVDIGVPQYDAGGVLGTNEEKYQGKYFKFEAPSSTMTQVLTLNSTNFPNSKVSPEEWLEITKHSLPDHMKENLTLHQYLNNYFVSCYRLNFANSEKMRNISGIDTTSTNLQGLVSTSGAGSSHYVSIFCETTSSLFVGLGREVKIVV